MNLIKNYVILSQFFGHAKEQCELSGIKRKEAIEWVYVHPQEHVFKVDLIIMKRIRPNTHTLRTQLVGLVNRPGSMSSTWQVFQGEGCIVWHPLGTTEVILIIVRAQAITFKGFHCLWPSTTCLKSDTVCECVWNKFCVDKYIEELWDYRCQSKDSFRGKININKI